MSGAWQGAKTHVELEALLAASGSGKEHLGRDMGANIPLVAAADVSDCVPLLVENAYVNGMALF